MERNIMFWIYYLLFAIINNDNIITGSNLLSTEKKQCIYVSSSKGYDCTRLDLTHIPQGLSSSVEVLEVSLNRIRELTSSSFTNYPFLKELYLSDNMIQSITNGTFNHLEYLQVLDLSVNSLVAVPSSIFHIPMLKILSLSKNTLLDTSSLINKAVPITSPLKHLDISFTYLNEMPNFGVIMYLVHLNITGNNLRNVSKYNFIGLCNLKVFTNVNLTMEFSTACECDKINKWFEIREITTIPSFETRCEFAAGKCFEDAEPTAEDMIIYEKCISEYQRQETTKTVLKIVIIVFSTLGGVILFCGICYIYYRWQSFSDDDIDINDKKSEKNSVQLLPKRNDYVNN